MSDRSNKYQTKVAIRIAQICFSFVLLFTTVAMEYGSSPIRIAAAEETSPYQVKDITLTPGTNETELNVVWLSSGPPSHSKVQLAVGSAKDMFPIHTAQSFEGISFEAVTYKGTVYYSNKVTMTGLTEHTDYLYRVGDGEHWSDVYTYSTSSFSNYNVLVFGDAQIGASRNVERDTYGWNRSVTKMTYAFPNTSFIISAGDQVENGYLGTALDFVESQHEGYAAPSMLRSIPVAPTLGNHDARNPSTNLHFYVPNENQQLGATQAGADYYYKYGEALFIVLNSNHMYNDTADASDQRIQEHQETIQHAIQQYPDTKWRIVTFHHDIYGNGPHAAGAGDAASVRQFRAKIVPVLETNNIDLVFTGHDHAYVRSKVMSADQDQGKQLQLEDQSDLNPAGITFVTTSSSSGSKYYELQNVGNERYIEKQIQHHKRMGIRLQVTPEQLAIETYELERTDGKADLDIAHTEESDPGLDRLTLVDTYRITKQPEEVRIQQNTSVTPATMDVYYAISKANAVQTLNVSFQYDNRTMEFGKANLMEPAVVDSNQSDSYMTIENDSTRGTLELAARLQQPLRTDLDTYLPVLHLQFKPKSGSVIGHLALLQSKLTTSNKTIPSVSHITQKELTVYAGQPVTDVRLTPSSLTLTVGQSQKITAQILPEQASHPELRWSSSRPEIAKVDADGQIHAIAQGVAEIQAETTDGSHLAQTVRVEVTRKKDKNNNQQSASSGASGNSDQQTKPEPTPNAQPIPEVPSTNPSSSEPLPPTQHSEGTSFHDVSSSHWASTAIQYLTQQHIVQGTREGEFEPDRSVTRAEFAAMLVRAFPIPSSVSSKPIFQDVPMNAWYYDAVMTLAQAGIIQGQSNLIFQPKAPITRQEMIVMTMRSYTNRKENDPMLQNTTSAFSDQHRIASWAIPYVKQAQALGWIQGRGDQELQPTGVSSRAEAAQMLYQLLSKTASSYKE
ncbi:S-layer homology domain-containing protein [Paenibacillus sp. WLX1005]|uniref:S-layer homology domain-containing protein n=1 Tax=Paenibacillus sp. WLX1005 TaxID=3243766 RepID=UPI003984362C